MTARASIVIPAHDEEAVIGRCLGALLGEAQPGEFEVIVVCNACTDATEEIAATFEAVQVLSIPEASKFAALEAGDAQATCFPRVYLDADVVVPSSAIREIVRTFAEDASVEAVSLPSVLDVSERSWLIRKYFQGQRLLPVYEETVLGSGIYALSESARARIGSWLGSHADDALVNTVVAPEARRKIPATTISLESPSTMQAVIRRAIRVRRLNRRIDVDASVGSRPPTGWRRFAVRAWQRGEVPAALVYVATQAVVRLLELLERTLGRESAWNSSR